MSAGNLTGLLADLVFESSNAPGVGLQAGSLFHLKFAADYPVVAVGAPAGVFFPDPSAHLGVELILPDHAGVANAFGAVMGSVLQRAHVTVTQPMHGHFIVHAEHGPKYFSNLREALSSAKAIAEQAVRTLARKAGATDVAVRISNDDNFIHHDVDGDLFLEAKITATATGRPNLSEIVSSRQ